MPPRKNPAADIYIAQSSGVVKIRNERVRYFAGRTKVRAGHPLLRARPDAFAPMALDFEVPQTPPEIRPEG